MFLPKAIVLASSLCLWPSVWAAPVEPAVNARPTGNLGNSGGVTRPVQPATPASQPSIAFKDIAENVIGFLKCQPTADDFVFLSIKFGNKPEEFQQKMMDVIDSLCRVANPGSKLYLKNTSISAGKYTQWLKDNKILDEILKYVITPAEIEKAKDEIPENLGMHIAIYDLVRYVKNYNGPQLIPSTQPPLPIPSTQPSQRKRTRGDRIPFMEFDAYVEMVFGLNDCVNSNDDYERILRHYEYAERIAEKMGSDKVLDHDGKRFTYSNIHFVQKVIEIKMRLCIIEEGSNPKKMTLKDRTFAKEALARLASQRLSLMDVMAPQLRLRNLPDGLNPMKLNDAIRAFRPSASKMDKLLEFLGNQTKFAHDQLMIFELYALL